MGHIYFETVEIFQSAFGPHADVLMGDIPNYTDIQPTIQTSALKIYSGNVRILSWILRGADLNDTCRLILFIIQIHDDHNHIVRAQYKIEYPKNL